MKLLSSIPLGFSLVCLPAFSSGLVDIRHDDTAGYVLYLDRTSIARQGSILKARFVFDFKSARTTDDEFKRSYKSVADYNLVNCEEETIASAGQDIYAGKKGIGKIVTAFRVKDADILFSGIVS